MSDETGRDEMEFWFGETPALREAGLEPVFVTLGPNLGRGRLLFRAADGRLHAGTEVPDPENDEAVAVLDCCADSDGNHALIGWWVPRDPATSGGPLLPRPMQCRDLSWAHGPRCDRPVGHPGQHAGGDSTWGHDTLDRYDAGDEP